MGLLKMSWALVYNNATMALKALSDGACAVVDDSLFHNLTVLGKNEKFSTFSYSSSSVYIGYCNMQ